MFHKIFWAFQTYKTYKILSILALIVFLFIFFLYPYGSFLELIKGGSVFYATSLYVINFLGFLFFPFTLSGIILFNRHHESVSIQVQDNATDGPISDLSRLPEYRKNILSFIFQMVGNGMIWFILLVMAVMSSDWCRDICFPYDKLVGGLSMNAFPLMVLITLPGVIYCYFLRNFPLMKKMITIGTSYWWVFSPLIYVGAMALFGFK